MSKILHTLEREVIDQVLKENPEFLQILGEISTRHDLPPLHVALISNYLQKGLPIGTPVEANKFGSMCDMVNQGFFSVVEHQDRLELVQNDFNQISGAVTRPPRVNRISQGLLGILAACILLGFFFLIAYIAN